MINWILIIIIVFGAVLIFRFVISKHSRHRLLITVIMLIILLFISSFYFVSVENNIDITTVNGFGKGLVSYSGWVFHVSQNILVLTGNAIGMDWGTNNKTIPQNISTNIGLIDSGKKAGGVIVNATVNVVNKVKPNTPKPIITYK